MSVNIEGEVSGAGIDVRWGTAWEGSWPSFDIVFRVVEVAGIKASGSGSKADL